MLVTQKFVTVEIYRILNEQRPYVRWHIETSRTILQINAMKQFQ